ncbi:unnamed protein product, partial [Phaedon cochleariae]
MEAVNGLLGDGDKGVAQPPSPLTGCYLLIVIGEPYTEQHKEIILQRIAKGLLSWDANDCLVDLEKELAIITEQRLEGEEARYGERLIQFASENLVTEILIHPVVSTLVQCMRNLLSSFTRHRHIIHAGYTFAANGSWALQDGTFSYADFSEAFQEMDVQRVIHAYDMGISLDIHCSPEGEWPRMPKEPYAKACKARINPADVLGSGSADIRAFVDYLARFLRPAALEGLLASSDVVGNIRFSRPTLYVFPGGQGDAALFGINGFNMLLDGGFSRKACFWDFVRHLDRLDAVLLTRLNNSNVGGISSILRRKKQDVVYPQIGHFFCNIQERRTLPSPDGDKDKDPLLINLLEEGHEIISNLRYLNLNPQVCYRDTDPINLYHKVGHGTLDMYVLSPSKDAKEVREFLQKWNQSDQKLFAKSSKELCFPTQNLVSIAALLIWQPANPDDTITRILFPGSSPQSKVFEGLDKLRSLDCIKHATCSSRSLQPVSLHKKNAKDVIIEKVAPKEKMQVKEIKTIENNIINGNHGDVKNKAVKKSDSTESDRSIKAKKEENKIIENGDKLKPKIKPKVRGESQQRKKPPEKKASPTTPKKTDTVEAKKPAKPSPLSTPAKSMKDANNRKVVESKVKREASTKPAPPKPKVEKKPIARKPTAKKAPISPAKKIVNGIQKPDSISRKGKLDKEGTTDSSTVSTPSVDQESVLKKDISKLSQEDIQKLKAQELADLKEEQEAVKEIEAVFRKGETKPKQAHDLREVQDTSIEKEEYIIIEKEVIEQDSLGQETKEDETQKLARDSEESEKQRKLSSEQIQANGITDHPEATLRTKDILSPEDKQDISSDKKTTDKDIEEENKDVVESHPDEKISANIKSGDTTTAPTLPEDERIPLDEINALDEIKEDNGHIIEEKHVKEETKEKGLPVIQLPQKTFESVPKIPIVVGIRLDKQQHIRDIVKTPDEVADLPVHEEVDYEYTHELKIEPTKSNEVVETKLEQHQPNKEQQKEEEQEKDKDEAKEPSVVQKELKSLTDTVLENETVLEKDILKESEKVSPEVKDEDHKKVVDEDGTEKPMSEAKSEVSVEEEEKSEPEMIEEIMKHKKVQQEAVEEDKQNIAEEKVSKEVESESDVKDKDPETHITDVTKHAMPVEDIAGRIEVELEKDTQKTALEGVVVDRESHEKQKEVDKVGEEKIQTEPSKQLKESSHEDVKGDSVEDKKVITENKESLIESVNEKKITEKIESSIEKQPVTHELDGVDKINENIYPEEKSTRMIGELQKGVEADVHDLRITKESVDIEKNVQIIQDNKEGDKKRESLKEDSDDIFIHKNLDGMASTDTTSTKEPKRDVDIISKDSLKSTENTQVEVSQELNQLEDLTDQEVAAADLKRDVRSGSIDKTDLGRKSPKEREEDVIKIVASVAEVLKSDAPLEEFEGKLPISTFTPYTSPYTTELRETHITTVDSPLIETKVIKTDIPTIPEEPHIASASFLEEERRAISLQDSEEAREAKRIDLLKQSQEFMMATSKMLSDIKSTTDKQTPVEEAKERESGVLSDNGENVEDKIDEDDVATVHRMLVTASSEDGGEEIEICPAGSIVFSKSSESSGRSSPDPSQKTKKSSIIDTVSDSLSTVRQILDDQSQKEAGIIDHAKQALEAKTTSVQGKSTTPEDIGESQSFIEQEVKSGASDISRDGKEEIKDHFHQETKTTGSPENGEWIGHDNVVMKQQEQHISNIDDSKAELEKQEEQSPSAAEDHGPRKKRSLIEEKSITPHDVDSTQSSTEKDLDIVQDQMGHLGPTSGIHAQEMKSEGKTSDHDGQAEIVSHQEESHPHQEKISSDQQNASPHQTKVSHQELSSSVEKSFPHQDKSSSHQDKTIPNQVFGGHESRKEREQMALDEKKDDPKDEIKDKIISKHGEVSAISSDRSDAMEQTSEEMDTAATVSKLTDKEESFGFGTPPKEQELLEHARQEYQIRNNVENGYFDESDLLLNRRIPLESVSSKSHEGDSRIEDTKVVEKAVLDETLATVDKSEAITNDLLHGSKDKIDTDADDKDPKSCIGAVEEEMIKQTITKVAETLESVADPERDSAIGIAHKTEETRSEKTIEESIQSTTDENLDNETIDKKLDTDNMQKSELEIAMKSIIDTSKNVTNHTSKIDEAGSFLKGLVTSASDVIEKVTQEVVDHAKDIVVEKKTNIEDLQTSATDSVTDIHTDIIDKVVEVDKKTSQMMKEADKHMEMLTKSEREDTFSKDLVDKVDAKIEESKTALDQISDSAIDKLTNVTAAAVETAADVLDDVNVDKFVTETTEKLDHEGTVFKDISDAATESLDALNDVAKSIAGGISSLFKKPEDDTEKKSEQTAASVSSDIKNTNEVMELLGNDLEDKVSEITKELIDNVEHGLEKVIADNEAAGKVTKETVEHLNDKSKDSGDDLNIECDIQHPIVEKGSDGINKWVTDQVEYEEDEKETRKQDCMEDSIAHKLHEGITSGMKAISDSVESLFMKKDELVDAHDIEEVKGELHDVKVDSIKLPIAEDISSSKSPVTNGLDTKLAEVETPCEKVKISSQESKVIHSGDDEKSDSKPISDAIREEIKDTVEELVQQRSSNDVQCSIDGKISSESEVAPKTPGESQRDEKLSSEIVNVDGEVLKQEGVLEESVQDLKDASKTITDVSKSVVFGTCEAKPGEKEAADQKTHEDHNGLAEDSREQKRADTDEVHRDTAEEKEGKLGDSAKDLGETYDTVAQLSKSLSFEKCEKPDSKEMIGPQLVTENGLQNLESSLSSVKSLAKDLEDKVVGRTKEVSDMVQHEVPNKIEEQLKDNAKDIGGTYDSVAELSRSLSFDKCEKVDGKGMADNKVVAGSESITEKFSHGVDTALNNMKSLEEEFKDNSSESSSGLSDKVQHEVSEKLDKKLQESAEDIGATYENVAQLSQSLSFDKCEKVDTGNEKFRESEPSSKSASQNIETTLSTPGSSAKDSEDKVSKQVPLEVSKEIEKLADSAEDICETYENISQLSESLSFDKCEKTDVREIKEIEKVSESGPISKIAPESVETITSTLKSMEKDAEDEVSGIAEHKAQPKVSREIEEQLKDSAKDIDGTFENVSELSKSLSSDKCERTVLGDKIERERVSESEPFSKIISDNVQTTLTAEKSIE